MDMGSCKLRRAEFLIATAPLHRVVAYPGY
jgi:hypothetical protein